MKEAIIERIKKLLAMGQSSNPNEASAFIGKAHALLAEHNLSATDLDETTTSSITFHGVRTPPGDWRAIIAKFTAKLNFAYHFVGVQTRNDTTSPVIHYFGGKEHNVVTAKLLFTYLLETARRKTDEIQVDGANEAYLDAWRQGFAIKIAQRLDDLYQKAVVGQTKKADGSNLPALRDLYEQLETDIKPHLPKSTEMVDVKDNRLDNPLAAFLGQIDAAKVGLDPQINALKRYQLPRG